MDLKRYLESTGETQESFAHRSGISQSQVSRLVHRQHEPLASTLERALRAMRAKPPKVGKLPEARDFRRKANSEESP